MIGGIRIPRYERADMSTEQHTGASRRDFLKTSTAVAIGSGLASGLSLTGAYAAGSDEIKVGVTQAGETAEQKIAFKVE